MRTILLIIVFTLITVMGIRRVFFFPAATQTVSPECRTDAPFLPTDRPIRVLIWNLQFGASRRHHFFYDGGKDVHVDPQEVTDNLNQIARIIQDTNADIVLLQEIDRDSARTGHIDQVAYLQQILNFACVASTPYFKVPHIPFPSHQHLGAMDMHITTMSRFAMGPSHRHQLALLNEPWYRRLFNLKRAALVTPVLTSGPPLHIINTHLSAFSNADDTLPKQVAQLTAIIDTLSDGAVLLGGDFNALPPDFDPANTAAPHMYHQGTTPIQPLFDSLSTPTSAYTLNTDAAKYGTFRPFRADKTDRTIDHIFGAGVQFEEHTVIHTDGLSDHEPILVTFRLGNGGAS